MRFCEKVVFIVKYSTHNGIRLNLILLSFLKSLWHLILPTLLVAASTDLTCGSQPNIVIIMCDDVGYSDLGCFGSEIETPNIDNLALGGLRFTQFYNNARCCPSRASLLTGLYAHQAGIGHMVDGVGPQSGFPAYSGELSQNSVTIAEVLRLAGYSTYLAGKWHVTGVINPTSAGEKYNWPLQRGFDRFYGTIHGAGSFFDPNTLTRDNSYISPFADPDYQPELFYYTDAINDQAIRFIHEHAKSSGDKPFFLYMAHTAAHWPLQAKETDIAKYRGRYDGGYGPVRAARLERMYKLGLVDQRWQIFPQVGDWSKVDDQAWEARCMEVFAAMLDCLDQGIGRLVTALKHNAYYENTLILFLQDNGGCAENMGRSEPGRDSIAKPSFAPLAKEYLQPDMIPKQTRDGYPVRRGKRVMPGGPDTFVGYGPNWANVSNTPFREYKHWLHEGGISTPLIAHWPNGIGKAQQGRSDATPTHLIDIMPTCLELGQIGYPNEFRGNLVLPLEGVSLGPAFRGEEVVRNHPIFWEHEGNRAVRVDQWKLVSKHPRGWELYDMTSDRTEMNDLSAVQPDRVNEMAMQWQSWAYRVGVRPWPLKGVNR